MMNTFLPTTLISLLINVGVPAIILYFIIKIAVKKAVKELKDENIL